LNGQISSAILDFEISIKISLKLSNYDGLIKDALKQLYKCKNSIFFAFEHF
jgi:hypothetical protein